MLAPALADPDPVLIFEHGSLYPVSGTLPVDPAPVDIEHAAIRRPGRDVTLVAYGGRLPVALDAATALAADGVDAEVVDLRVLRPLDEDTVLTSVRRTHRLVVVDEGWRSGSLSAEVAARVGEHAFYDLDAPVERVASVEVPMPYARHLEEAALPQVGDVVAAVRRVLGG
jgi:pyruvate dehydrogenase E1 component beta subunit